MLVLYLYGACAIKGLGRLREAYTGLPLPLAYPYPIQPYPCPYTALPLPFNN